MLHSLELEFIRFIQKFKSPVFDKIFTLLDFFDNPVFFFMLIPITWLVYGSKTGARLFYLLMLSSLINCALKKLFLFIPRPFDLDPNIAFWYVADGYRFPSMAAQSAILLLALSVNVVKNRWKWFAFSYIFLVSFSRVYLGLHFPSDILAGWLVGLILWAVYIYSCPLMEKLCPEVLFLISQLAVVPAIILQNSIHPIYICNIGIATGLLVSHYCKLSLHPPVDYKECILRSGVGIFGVFFCCGLAILFSLYGKTQALYLGIFSSGIWMSLGASFICSKISLHSPLTYKYILGFGISALGVFFWCGLSILLSVVYMEHASYLGVFLLALWFSLGAPFIFYNFSNQKETKCVKN